MTSTPRPKDPAPVPGGVRPDDGARVTGTPDRDYNLVWFVYQCLDHVDRLEGYIADADRDGDHDLVALFRNAQVESRKGADVGKQMLRVRLRDDTA